MIGIVFKVIVVADAIVAAPGIVKRGRGGFFDSFLGFLRVRAAIQVWEEMFSVSSQGNVQQEEDRQSHTNVLDWLSLPHQPLQVTAVKTPGQPLGA